MQNMQSNYEWQNIGPRVNIYDYLWWGYIAKYSSRDLHVFMH